MNIITYIRHRTIMGVLIPNDPNIQYEDCRFINCTLPHGLKSGFIGCVVEPNCTWLKEFKYECEHRYWLYTHTDANAADGRFCELCGFKQIKKIEWIADLSSNIGG